MLVWGWVCTLVSREAGEEGRAGLWLVRGSKAGAVDYTPFDDICYRWEVPWCVMVGHGVSCCAMLCYGMLLSMVPHPPSTGEGVAEFSCVALPQWGTVVVASSTSLEVHILS